MTRLILMSAAACVVIVSGIAAAQMGPPSGPAAFGRAAGGEHGPHARRGVGLFMLGAADLNGDNTVTVAELTQLHAEEFAYRDRNGDGYLDREDASPTMQHLAEMRGEEEGGRRGARRPGARLDADEDGRISRAEFVNREHPVFDELDADSNGALSPQELDAAVDARAERREARYWWRD